MVSRRSDKDLEKKSLGLRNRELEAQKSSRPRAWRVKQTVVKAKPSAKIDIVFLLPSEFRDPSKYDEEEYDEEELEEVVAQLTLQS